MIEETVHMLAHATDKHGQPIKRPNVKLINKAGKEKQFKINK